MQNNLLKIAFSFLLFSLSAKAYTQSIVIDGRFDDWTGITTNAITDAAADGNGLDFISMAVTNDENNLYIKIEVKDSTLISDNNNVYLNIDGDKNSSTGLSVNTIGAELGWRLGYRYGFYYHGTNKDTVFASQINIVSLPTHQSKIFEIAISRTAQLSTGVNLFTNDSVRIALSNGVSGGDQMPNSGKKFTYGFDNNINSAFKPIDLSKCSDTYIRFMSYNVLFDGLIDVARQASFQRIFKCINPDVVVLNECTNTTYQQVKTLFDTWMPVTGGWKCYKVDPGNLVCSKYPILYAKNVSFRKATFAYIDLPSSYSTDLVVVGTHLYPGGDGDSIRQREADNIAKFIKDMKAGNGGYTVPQNTPFVIAGDFNMVGSYNPLNTILTGSIVNSADFGTAGLPDWNNAPLSSVYALVSHRNMAYTWKNQSPTSKSWPGKLDYIVHSNTNLKIKKSFVLQTEWMSSSDLTKYGLQANDNSIASDHLPIVADLRIPTTTINYIGSQWNGSVNTAWENPGNWDCSTVPDEYSNVTIPTSAPRYPLVNFDTEIHQLNLNKSSRTDVQPGKKLLINGR